MRWTSFTSRNWRHWNSCSGADIVVGCQNWWIPKNGWFNTGKKSKKLPNLGSSSGNFDLYYTQFKSIYSAPAGVSHSGSWVWNSLLSQKCGSKSRYCHAFYLDTGMPGWKVSIIAIWPDMAIDHHWSTPWYPREPQHRGQTWLNACSFPRRWYFIGNGFDPSPHYQCIFWCMPTPSLDQWQGSGTKKDYVPWRCRCPDRRAEAKNMHLGLEPIEMGRMLDPKKIEDIK